MKTAVVGHVEWIEFLHVDHVPAPGEIVHADDVFGVPAGGGPVVAVQLLKLAGDCTFFTALGDDELGHRCYDDLVALGLRVEAVFRDEPQRRGFTYIDRDGERTITIIGSRLGPHGDDALPWDGLDGTDAVFFTAGDDAAFTQARRAETLVVTSREMDRLVRMKLPVDAVVGSANDPAEAYVPYEPPPGVVVATNGAKGGTYMTAAGMSGTFGPGALEAAVVCAYGAGDSFMGALTYALGAQQSLDDALTLAADCGAACLTGRGPYAGQLTL